MADWKSLIMSDGKKEFLAKPEKPPVDPTPKRRQKVLEGIDKVLAGSAPRGWIKTNNNIAQVSVRLGSRPLSLDGATEVYIPAERSGDFYKAIKADLAAGKLDDAIKALFEDKAGKSAGDKGGNGKKTRILPGWSPERRARHEAKKAAKAK